MTRFPCLVLAASLLAGCSARTDPWPTATGTSNKGDAATDGVAKNLAALPDVPSAATEASDPLETRAIRPIPEVISKPRLFELPPSLIAAIPLLEATAIEPIEFPSKESPTVVEVRGMMQDYLAALKRRDAALLAAHWSESGENVDLDSGETTRGRQSIRRVFSSLFEKQANADVEIDVTSIRPIRDEVAVVDGTSLLACPGERPARSRFSAVVVKQDDKWLLESVREAAMPTPDDAEITKPLATLGWLLGHWENAGSDRMTGSTHCFWSAREAYLVRSHTIAATSPQDGDHAGRVVSFEESSGASAPSPPSADREITEIIGWDPVSRSIRSWIFCSDGGFGEGTWSRDGERLRVLVDGTLADGRPASGTLTITKLGADEISCTVTGEGLEQLLPPAGDFLRTARASVAP